MSGSDSSIAAAAAPSESAERLQAICLDLPEAVEQEAWGAPTFRVRGKIFAIAQPHRGDPAVWCKAPPGSQELLIGADAQRFFAPPYLGPKGWVGVCLAGGCDWTETALLIRRSYRLVAPKRLAALVPEPEASV